MGQVYDVVTFLEIASRILHHFKEDKVSRNAHLLVTFRQNNFSVCIKIVSIFSHIWTESQILSIYGQIRIRENPYFDIFHTVFNMISVGYRHVYSMIILTMVRLFFGHILYNLLAKAWYGNFLLLSINWPILIIWLSNVPLYACFFRRVLNIKILSFPHMARELSVQIEWRRILAKCNCSF